MDERLAGFNVGDTYQIVDLIGQFLVWVSDWHEVLNNEP
jgi:hypothetical protein